MTGHEIGAALGVSVLSAVATAAGALTTPAGAAAALERGFLVAAALAVTFGLIALVRMQSVRGAAGGHLHMH
jgi:hypothetical protein